MSRIPCQVASRHVMEKISMSEQSPQKRINISIIGEEAELLEKLQIKLNQKLMMQLSMSQIMKRLIKQAAATEL